jgi:sporulation protein YlmC with PRC-barrel domain
MKRTIVVATTGILYLCVAIASAQQQTQPGMQGQSSGSSGTSGQTQGAPGMPGQSSGASGAPAGPVAGRATLGVTVVEMEAVVIGWSAKRDLLGKTVLNDKKDKIGKIEDIIITPAADSKIPFASFAIIGVGGFLGIGRNDVAIPMEQIKLEGGNLVLAGATKEALKALPKFEYARKK